jgi:hypothetical protein
MLDAKKYVAGTTLVIVKEDILGKSGRDDSKFWV